MAMTSRDRLVATLNHKSPDRVCVDFGGTHVTGISASALTELRMAVLGEKDFRVRVHEPYQMLGEIDDKLAEALGIDVVGVLPPKNMFGFESRDWKPFTMFDGTEVLVPGSFNLTPDGKGGWFIHPEGDTSVPPSGHMPRGGFYFDAIPRQGVIDDDKLDPQDNLEEFALLDDYTVNHLVREAGRAAAAGKGAVLSAPGTGFGDIALVPAMWMKHTKGIREIEEWYVSTVIRRDYVYKVFEKQCEIALVNLARLTKALGDNVQAVFTTGTDFGTQTGLFISPEAYRDLFKPFHKAVNDLIHKNSNWKVFIHSCGSVVELLPDFIEAGFDILNPVQCSARGMQGQHLKKAFGKELVFWGGGVDTQRTLPFGTPEDVYREVSERIGSFNRDGGFVFNSTHNIQAKTPVKNLLAMFKAIRDSEGKS